MTNLSLETPAAAAVPQMQPTEHPDKPQAHHHAQEPASKTPGLPFDVLRQPRNDGGRKRRWTNDDEGAPCSPLGRLGRRRRRGLHDRGVPAFRRRAPLRDPCGAADLREVMNSDFLCRTARLTRVRSRNLKTTTAQASPTCAVSCADVLGRRLGGPALGPRLRPRRSVGAVQPRFAAPSSKAPRPSSPPPSSPSSSSSSFALHPVTVSTRSFKENTVMKKADTGKAR